MMKKLFLFLSLVLLPLFSLRAAETPTLLVVTTTDEEVRIPIASIKKITYDQSSLSTMYIITQSGTKTFALSNVKNMKLTDVPVPSAISEVEASETTDSQKILINGQVYIVKDGQVFTVKGEKVQ